MDFYSTSVKKLRGNNRQADIMVSPDFLYDDTKDIVCKGGSMYAFWNEDRWDTSISSLIRKIDSDTRSKVKELRDENPGKTVAGKYMRLHSSGVRAEFEKFVKLMPQSDVVFNRRIIFSADEIRKEDYSTARLTYTPKEGETEAFDTLVGRLYSPEEQLKIMWFMGALLSNRMGNIQKFMFLYGGKGTGKGTIIKIFKKVFAGYYAPIDLHELTGNGAFATAQVQEVPLLIDDDTDLSTIKNDTNLLKLVAHEPINVNRKYQSPYDVIFNGLLITASNQRFKVRNVDSGITRRAIVVEPTTYTFKTKTYFDLMTRIEYEIPAIAYKAIKVFEDLGEYYFENYVDLEMIEATDYIFGFVQEYKDSLGDQITLKQASALYKEYLDDLGYESKGYKRKIKTELQRYYRKFYSSKKVDGVLVRNVFEGLKRELIFPDYDRNAIDVDSSWLDLDTGIKSKLDEALADCPAQYANADKHPKMAWKYVRTTVKDLNTSKLHYVRVPENHIVIDFDLKNEKGEKDYARNVDAANKLPKTYCETSMSGNGLHLHYIYDGDVEELSDILSDGIEIKVYRGKSSLRRKLTKCNNLEIAHISSGLPLKEVGKKVYEGVKTIAWNEKKMRGTIEKCLKKEVWPNTAPNMSLIVDVFKQAQEQGVEYDLSDMKEPIYIFASKSTNQWQKCTKMAEEINYSTISTATENKLQTESSSYPFPVEDLYFFDIEVFPNMWMVVIKQYGKDCQTFINPSPSQVEEILSYPLVGFNNRRYDNHILYAGLMGMDNQQIYIISSGIINGLQEAKFGAAYELSYADIYEYASKKQSLKKWEIEMGIKHDEFEYDFNEPLDVSLWPRCAEYCQNDVIATEELFKYTKADYAAREILSALSGLTINAPTRAHAANIIFEGDKNPQDSLVYTDLSTMFPGYKYSFGKSEYRGEDPSEGGYVYSEPGVYYNVALLDIESMHPTSLIELNYFGKYTKNFADLKQARIYIKHGQFEEAKTLFGGKLAPYLEDKAMAKSLSFALKIVINSIYGYTSAKFDNPFRHVDNVDNIIAKRGALFMIDLKHAVQEKGYTVAHIKTDSIKIPDADDEIIEFVSEMGRKYGYKFELEHTYKRMALINKAVYIAETEDGAWEATGAEFADPFVYKTLFTGEPIEYTDFFITKQVTTSIYIGDNFVGRIARVYASKTGDDLWRVNGDKKGFVTGTKGFKWKLASEYTDFQDIDMEYYQGLVHQAIADINKVGPSGEIIRFTSNWYEKEITYKEEKPNE